jgi:hypothetical protein
MGARSHRVHPRRCRRPVECVEPDRSRRQLLPGEHRRHTGRCAVRFERRHRRDPAVSTRLDDRRDLRPGRRQHRDGGRVRRHAPGRAVGLCRRPDLPEADGATGFDLRTGALGANYELPDRGICADIALAHGDVYITDTTDPTAATRLPGRILRLTTPRPMQADGGTLTVWSADPLFTSPVPASRSTRSPSTASLPYTRQT